MPDLFQPEEEKEEKKAETVTIKTANEPLIHTGPIAHSENHMHTLSSFCQNPVGITFQSQNPNEKILLFLRAHFATNLPWIILTIFFAFLPPILSMLFSVIGTPLPFLLPSGYITVLLSLYYLSIFAYAFVSFITWFYNIFFVTTERVIDIDFSQIVFHNVAATKIDLVEDVDYNQIGFIPSLFDYGTVTLNTASSEALFEAVNVPHPARAVSIIGDIIGENP